MKNIKVTKQGGRTKSIFSRFTATVEYFISIGVYTKVNYRSLFIVLLVIAVYLGINIGNLISTESSYAETGALDEYPNFWQGGVSDNGASTEVKVGGYYNIHVSGGNAVPAGWSNAYYDGVANSGNLTGKIWLNKGDIVSVLVIDGGASVKDPNAPPSGTGGKAVMIYVNGEKIIGAGGAGGSCGHQYRKSSYNKGIVGQNVTGINNELFSSGAGGGSGYYYGNSVTKTVGKPGNTIEGCIPASGGAIIIEGGAGAVNNPAKAGFNYLNTERCELVEELNNSNTVYFMVSKVIEISEDVENALPNLGGSELELKLTEDVQLKCVKSGTYYIDLWGEGVYINGGTWGGSINSQGGYVRGAIQLKKNDMLNIVLLPGGINPNYNLEGTTGGRGVAVYINDTLVLGAGGCGGGQLYKSSDSTSGSGGNSVIPYALAPLSGGGGGTGYKYNDGNKDWYYTGTEGTGAIAGFNAKGTLLTGGSYGQAGGNYINTSMVEYGEQIVNAIVADAAARDPKIKITNTGVTEKTVEELINSSVDNKIMISVSVNSEFSVKCIATTKIDSNVSPAGIEIEVENQEENILRISGNLSTVGTKIFECGELRVVVDVLPEPSSSNIIASF